VRKTVNSRGVVEDDGVSLLHNSALSCFDSNDMEPAWADDTLLGSCCTNILEILSCASAYSLRACPKAALGHARLNARRIPRDRSLVVPQSESTALGSGAGLVPRKAALGGKAITLSVATDRLSANASVGSARRSARFSLRDRCSPALLGTVDIFSCSLQSPSRFFDSWSYLHGPFVSPVWCATWSKSRGRLLLVQRVRRGGS